MISRYPSSGMYTESSLTGIKWNYNFPFDYEKDALFIFKIIPTKI